ncbi:hypothetical protein JQ597_22010 [Bradyrhizobium sp. AUGA SZCCT0177]|uniref:hypothetical protein n=1 Tax=unclassified Bradyrhizobium TaxID=2631580 RepID=UPI001BA94B22|nr:MULTISPECIES: hypothetical protein [unclassified Bradyrhizobium]MBR1233286.1 hypothetical protein [Bradyrhizobium sp. AUGA SZCCT0182]MBR1284726.1 hypothetical protein [Bradyrhizobium sp. AUGA SZCCT0177]
MTEASYDLIRSRAASFNWRITAIAAFTVLVVAVAALVHVVPYGRAVWDFVFILDGAYRIGVGQVPHVDFASPIGPLTLYLTHFAERLFPGGQPFIGLHALAWLMVVPPFAVIASRIQSPWGFFASFAVLAVVVLVPYTLDSSMLSEISYFATYNRFATAILFLAALWYVLPKARGDGVLLGYLLTALIFIKITAAIAMLGLVVAAVLLGRARPAALFAMLFVTAALAGLVELATGGLVSGYLHDIVSMSALNRGGAVFRLAASSARNWLPLVVTITIVVLAARELDFIAAVRRPLNFVRETIAREAFVVDAALLVAVALAAESQNTGGVGLIAAAAVLFHPSLRTTRGWRLIAAAVLGATLVLPMADVVEKRVVSTFVREKQGTTDHGFSTFLPGMRVPTATLAGSRLMTRLQSEWLPFLDETANNGFDLDGDPGSTSPATRAAWAVSVAEAGANFQRLGYATKAQRYTTIDFAESFPRLLGLTPARGTTLAMDFRRTVPAFSVTEASAYLADADGVFFRTCVLPGATDTNPATFRTVLEREFTRHKLHPCWDFYSRTR